jgi:hypothetical protein
MACSRVPTTRLIALALQRVAFAEKWPTSRGKPTTQSRLGEPLTKRLSCLGNGPMFETVRTLVLHWAVTRCELGRKTIPNCHHFLLAHPGVVSVLVKSVETYERCF